ncbi:MAG: isoprenyl transferase [Phycisphaerales bacterium]|nr:MAG: isoprenyl transferase [Phycisphaerales bacterium]
METFEEKLSRTASRLGLAIEQLPRHIAIIMDGNGRWAQQRSLPRVEGHREGAGIIENIAMHCVDIGIESLTLYSFSIENWKRPQSEINALMHIHSEHLVSIRPTLMENNVRLLHLGRVAGLPQSVQNDLAETVEMTVSNTGMKLALALNYSGRVEIVDATRKIAQEFKNGTLSLDEIDEQCVSNHLYGAGLPDPDLLIRTANEMRISNFLLWQISYSEFYVTKTLWPSFTKESLEKAIMAYAKRSRRFGTIETAL